MTSLFPPFPSAFLHSSTSPAPFPLLFFSNLSVHFVLPIYLECKTIYCIMAQLLSATSLNTKWLSYKGNQLSIAPWLGMGGMWPSPFSSRMLPGFILDKSFANKHRCYKFLIAFMFRQYCLTQVLHNSFHYITLLPLPVFLFSDCCGRNPCNINLPFIIENSCRYFFCTFSSVGVI